MTDMLTPDYTRNMRILGHSDQGGRADGIQIMVSGGYAYVGHVFNNGFSVIDVRDPRSPRFLRHIPQPEGTWSQHLQTHGDLLIVNNMCDMLRVETSGAFDPGDYYKGSVADKVEIGGAGRKEPFLLPFTRAIVPTVDLAAGRIIADPPDGLD